MSFVKNLLINQFSSNLDYKALFFIIDTREKLIITLHGYFIFLIIDIVDSNQFKDFL